MVPVFSVHGLVLLGIFLQNIWLPEINHLPRIIYRVWAAIMVLEWKLALWIIDLTGPAPK
jgi:hypothetical protein